MIRKSQLVKENERLRKKVYILENIGIGLNSSVKEKERACKRFLEDNPAYTPYEVCTAIGLNRGTFYNFLHNKVEEPWFARKEAEVTKLVKEVFEESRGVYGQDRIVIALRSRGISISKETVSRIMKRNGLRVASVVKRPAKSVRRDRQQYYRNLLKRQFDQDAPNKVWASDFLEIRIGSVRYYLCVILDLYARMVVAWRVSPKRSDRLALNTFRDAYASRNEPVGLIFHTDQGSEFRSHLFMDSLRFYGVRQSFSYPGAPTDNACMEGFYSTLRKEEINININSYVDRLALEKYLSEYFAFYNGKRIHTSNKGLPPMLKEEEWRKKRL
ncbi:MAG: IS3 family transposase [Bacilli bacterium]|nr:IS3 family transposase [Bacilli bacterium]